MNSLQIFVSEDGAEAEHLERLAGLLRHDLLQLEVDEVTTVRRGDDPAGARGVAFEAGALLVDLGSSVAILKEVLHAVVDWWRRSRSRPTIRLEMDGDVLEISEASTDQVNQSIEIFGNRHSTHGAAS
ncbi:hypothetical protein AB0953_21975 [Streptomyces sp. NPDC046866]|uniref:effector-associated constant component EACC1 n=1 Tax=Streptomyces sp. NPDC046866 TaxID=3154921 RepID=UPI003451C63D